MKEWGVQSQCVHASNFRPPIPLYARRLDKECEIFLLAEAANHGQPLVEVDPDDAAFTYKHTGSEAIGYFLASVCDCFVSVP